MTLPLELGGVRDPTIRRALEELSKQFPIVATGGGGGGAPSGPAGGVLGGTYPNPGFAADMATQAELDTHTALTTTAHGGIVASTDARLTDARTPTAHHTTHEPGGTDAMAVDAAAATGSLRTLGTTATSASAGNRGLPVGGTAGQVLAKNTATDYDAGWSTPAAGGGGSVSSPWVAVVTQAADVTNATITNVDTDLVFNFDANSTYVVDLYLMVTAAATTTGVAFAWDTSVAVTTANLTFEHQLATAGTLTGGDAVADDTVRGLSSGVPTAAAITPIIGMGLVVTGATAGTCRLRFRPEVAASATFKAASTMRVMKVGGTTSGIPEVTALPATPANGQEVYLLVDSAGTYGGPHTWHCRYRSATTGTYKWHVLGGQPLVITATGGSGVPGTAYVDPPGGALGITVPNAGVYVADINARLAANGIQGFVSYAVGATAASDVWSAEQGDTGGNYSQAHRRYTQTIATAGTFAVKYRGSTAGGTVWCEVPRLEVLPQRII